MGNDYDALNRALTHAALQLDLAAGMVRDLGLAPEQNIKKIGDALAGVFEIQHQLFEIRPDLKPDFLK